jgi:hypothetical protein
MEGEPCEPRWRAREPDVARQLHDRRSTADRRHRALVVVVQRLGLSPVDQSSDLEAGVSTALNSGLGELRQWVVRGDSDVADGEDAVMPEDSKILADSDAAAAALRQTPVLDGDAGSPDGEVRLHGSSIFDGDLVASHM